MNDAKGIPWARGEILEYVMASDERQFVLNHSDAFSFLSEAGQNRNNLINAAQNALNEITSVPTALPWIPELQEWP